MKFFTSLGVKIDADTYKYKLKVSSVISMSIDIQKAKAEAHENAAKHVATMLQVSARMLQDHEPAGFESRSPYSERRALSSLHLNHSLIYLTCVNLQLSEPRQLGQGWAVEKKSDEK